MSKPVPFDSRNSDGHETASSDLAKNSEAVTNCDVDAHTPSIAFWHLPRTLPELVMPLNGSFFNSAQLSTDATSERTGY